MPSSLQAMIEPGQESVRLAWAHDALMLHTVKVLQHMHRKSLMLPCQDFHACFLQICLQTLRTLVRGRRMVLHL